MKKDSWRLDKKKWIVIDRNIFNNLRTMDGLRWFGAFRVVAGLLRYATTTDSGLIKFDDSLHRKNFCRRLGIKNKTLSSYLYLLKENDILKGAGWNKYRLNADAMQVIDNLPAKPEKKREKNRYDSTWEAWDEHRTKIEYRRLLYEQETEELILLLKKKVLACGDALGSDLGKENMEQESPGLSV